MDLVGPRRLDRRARLGLVEKLHLRLVGPTVEASLLLVAQSLLGHAHMVVRCRRAALLQRGLDSLHLLVPQDRWVDHLLEIVLPESLPAQTD